MSASSACGNSQNWAKCPVGKRPTAPIGVDSGPEISVGLHLINHARSSTHCSDRPKTTKRLTLSDKTLRFTVPTGVLPAWLQICLRCKFGRDEIERLATGNQESMRNIG
jgi:hypothetical protein